MKSSYRTALLISKEDYGLGESSGQRLWKSQLPNKIKVFGWRVCQDILPTRENLAITCGLCRQNTESVLHVMWECGAAQDVWAASRICLQKCARSQSDILRLVEDLMDRLTANELELFLVQCWIIWSQRNLVMHGGVIQDPNRLHKPAEDFLKEYRQV